MLDALRDPGRVICLVLSHFVASGLFGVGLAQPKTAPKVEIVRFGDPLVGQAVEFKAVANFEGGSYRWRVVSGADRVTLSDADKQTCQVKGEQVSTGLDDVVIEVTYTKVPLSPLTARARLTVLKVDVRSFSFRSSGGPQPNDLAIAPDGASDDPKTFTTDATPSWQKGRKREGYPVAYLRTNALLDPRTEARLTASKMALFKPALTVQPFVYGRSLSVRVVGSLRPEFEYTFEYTTVAGRGLATFNGLVVSKSPLPDFMTWVDKFTTTWSVAAGGDKSQGLPQFHDLPTKPENRLYVTLDKPRLVKTRRYESLFWIACQVGEGVRTQEDFLKSFLAALAARNRIKNVRGETIGYYRGSTYCNEKDPQGRPIVPNGLSGALVKANGRCLAWAELFLAVVDLMGLPEGKLLSVRADTTSLSVPPGKRVYLMVKDFQFKGPSYPRQPFPYTFNDADPAFPKWPNPDVTDKPGVPGQDNPNPPAFFWDHAIVKLGDSVYDPSYGGEYGKLGDKVDEGPKALSLRFQSKSLDGLSILDAVPGLFNAQSPVRKLYARRVPEKKAVVAFLPVGDPNRKRGSGDGKSPLRGSTEIWLPQGGEWSWLTEDRARTLGDLVKGTSLSEALQGLVSNDPLRQGLSALILSEKAITDDLALAALLGTGFLLEVDAETYPRPLQTSTPFDFSAEPQTVEEFVQSVHSDWLGVSFDSAADFSDFYKGLGDPATFVRPWVIRLSRSRWDEQALQQMKLRVSNLPEDLRWAVVTEAWWFGFYDNDEASSLLKGLSPSLQLAIRLKLDLLPNEPLFTVSPVYQESLQDAAILLLDS